MTPREFTVSVRDLVHFVLRTGNLGGQRGFVSPMRALEGTRGHQRVQKARPPEYKSEVSVSQILRTELSVLKVHGRLDGMMETADSLLIEEIKTVSRSWNRQADPLHWAQAKCYAHMLLQEKPFDRIELRLTYLDLDSMEEIGLQQTAERTELQIFFTDLTTEYLRWVDDYVRWISVRDGSIKTLPFPFPSFRPGQRSLAVSVYRTLAASGRLFVEAPTGIGKTLSSIYPSLKALGEGRVSKLFYLTSKRTERHAAEHAFAEMRHAGLRCRTLTLTAKEKICSASGAACDPATCPLAIGYYDRVKPALRSALVQESLTRDRLEQVAQTHQVCPFELSLDASAWVDVIICDYNHVFDPQAYLRRFFADAGEDRYALLVDEAHNLPDRAREMFSAELARRDFVAVRKSVLFTLPACSRALQSVNRLFLDLGKPAKESGEPSVSREIPAKLIPALKRFMTEAEQWLAKNELAEFNDSLLELYFSVLRFLRTADLFDEHYVAIFEPKISHGRLRLFCLDPSKLIQNALKRGASSVFFSATLTPIHYFRRLLSSAPEDKEIRLTSPFPPENFCLLLADNIATDFKSRHATYGQVAEAIDGLLSARPGNYLAFFPSYEYLNQVAIQFQTSSHDCQILLQKPSMSDDDRNAFVTAFHRENSNGLVGFAVLGGLFGEGLDLLGDRLLGAIIVGVGLPQVCLERDLIRDYFDQQNGSGFEHAYTFPGFNRVLQAVGRVIRSEHDRGIALLIDTRFNSSRYRALFPPWWHPRKVRSREAIRAAAAEFWNAPVAKPASAPGSG